MKSLLPAFLLMGALFTASPAVNAGWMAEFSSVPLNALVLPGTHDSATYRDAGLGISPDEPSLAWLPRALDPVVARWSIAQDLDIQTQLQQGYRYLDIRLCAYGSAVYTCHGVYMVPIEEVLDEVRFFLDSRDAKSEVVVLDFNHFYGLDASLQAQVAQQLRLKLGAFAAIPAHFPAAMRTPVGQFVADGAHLIINYADDPTQKANADLLWPAADIDSPWPNLQHIDALERWLAANPAAPTPQPLYVHQAQLTPGESTIASGLIDPEHQPDSLQTFTAGYTEAGHHWMNTRVGKAAVGNGGVILQDFADDWLVDYAVRRNRDRFPQQYGP